MRIPDRDHVVVHLLQLLLGGLQGVWGRVELVGLEALVGETDSERLVILLYSTANAISIESSQAWRGVFQGFQVFRTGSTNLRDVLGVRRGGVGGDGATGDRGKSLTAQRRSLASRSTEEHGAGGCSIEDWRRGIEVEGDSDTFPIEMLGTNFPDYLSASPSGAAGVDACKQVKPGAAL